MRRTFCDRCGAQCVNTTGHVGGYVEHTTSQGQQVGTDELVPGDLCKDCTTAVIEFIGLKVVPREMEKQLQNTFDGGMHGRGDFDSITVHGGHYTGPADVPDTGIGDDHERPG